MQEARIRLELWRAAGELTGGAQNDAGAAVHGLDRAANLHVFLTIAGEIPDSCAVVSKMRRR